MNRGELLPEELEAGIDELLDGTPLPAVLDRHPAEVRPYLRIFALMLRARPRARPGFREELRARLLGQQAGARKPPLALPDPAAINDCLTGVVIDPALASVLARYAAAQFGEPAARLLDSAMDERDG
jgi:hypothetical protein